MGQIFTLDAIMSIIEIKSSHDMKMYPQQNYRMKKCNVKCQTYNPDKIFYDPEYMMDYILNVELIEEPVIAKYVEDMHGIFLDVV
jgi:hypothetical protein